MVTSSVVWEKRCWWIVDGGWNNVEGLLGENLRTLGISPDEIDAVLLTHCHIGGLLDADGKPVYPRAAIYLHPLEADYWLDDDNLVTSRWRVVCWQRGAALPG
jgi:glyoxylase-like metal-dependent hydrolase (beta-lactamase superfamily II)